MSTAQQVGFIKSELIADEAERLKILPALFGAACTDFESSVYAWLRYLSDYNGGYWNFYRLDNGGFFMAPQTDKTFELVCPNYFNGELNADAAGIVACLYTFSNMSFDERHAHLAEFFHRLRDYAAEHPDSELIFRAID